MKLLKLFLVSVTGLLLITSCQSPFSSKTDTVKLDDFVTGEEFKVSFGDSALSETENITVKFSALLEEGRCSIDVHCFWAGNAKINLKTTINGETDNLELDTHSDMLTTTNFEGYTLELVKLEPYPKSVENPIPEEEYIATILIDEQK